ncbi:hypothetical protein A8C56_15055 [Niabella ginsenosidivorans]|uniref:Lipocalin-like domain-containing protein n=1 Tax=Niabella ginsenosidivorans TaxID=1176587 RepID=A0A1A9I6E9_9BACT|nr:hypothetical protein [Niabella ginsenosidivorans]ANH82114.1 hypothetical protein A8C56_15055 [Niabella ginsenosidivorans]
MKMQLYLLIAILFLACSRQHNPALPLQKGIEGKWKLVKTADDNVHTENYIVSFDATGAVKASDYPCAGTFTFDKEGGQDLSENNLTVEFRNCNASRQLWYSIRGHANARFPDDNTLVLNNRNCDEGCPRVFKRINE